MHKLEYNYILVSAVVSWFVAQIIKTFLHFILTKKFKAERLIGAGGMPSSHSALICSATIAVSRKCGIGSAEFAIMFLVAMIVMYDAMGVRRAAGLHAREINRMNRLFISKESIKSSDSKDIEQKRKELKEYLGHTPFEVLGGALLGILIAMTMPVG
jgi:acid phosphatase family membrane protein YuiD